MRGLGMVLVGAMVVLGTVTSVSARPYVSGSAGVVLADDAELRDNYGDRADLSFDVGAGFAGAIGASNEKGLRGEVEFAYRYNEMDEFNASWSGSYQVDGEVSTFSVMGNLYVDFFPGEMICPFMVGGIGFANIDADIDYYGSDNDSVFAYQLGGGVAFSVGPYTKLDLQYRYFATEDPDFAGIEADYDTHNIFFGIRQSF
ncbi:outer membrane protein [Trichloromonas sp.]|uniref:outer membrane protein n=1 Tax=Trichloromonas sp. TaxID=3069249 RepID=UPI002A3FA190|nr:outer membrane beta-barrel protein [Trichloromonas sp.]